MQGQDAEQLALDFLRRRGLSLLARNWRCKAGELDLVMHDGDTVVIAEVRSRTRADFGSAAETVDRRKQQRLARATRLFLMRHPHLGERPLRFDIVAINGGRRIEWLRGAFEVEE